MRRAQPAGVSRRSFLGRVAGAGVAASGLGTLLTSCGLGSAAPKRPSPLPDPKSPVMWPIAAANQSIAGGQRPEAKATLKVFAGAGRVGARRLGGFFTA